MAGAVVTKSISLHPREGYKNPTVVELDGGMLDAMGLPNPGIEEYAAEVRRAASGAAPASTLSVDGAVNRQ